MNNKPTEHHVAIRRSINRELAMPNYDARLKWATIMLYTLAAITALVFWWSPAEAATHSTHHMRKK